MSGLTKAEKSELIGLIQAIDITECFGSRDVLRREMLERRSTKAQFRRVYRTVGYPNWKIDKMLD